MADKHAIVVDNLTKQFTQGERPAVNGCSFVVEEGQFIVFLGPSGCGKTTLLKMINRLYEPSSGRILINDQNVLDVPVTTLRRQIGYVIQQTGLFPHMRIEANIAVVPRLLGWTRDRIDQRIDELLDLVGLPRAYRRRYPRQLSGGEQQRVGIARALAADPQILLMDEPFGALDAITRTRLQDELLMIQRRLHKTILFVTHDVDEALRLADKLIVMRAGHIVQFAPPLDVLTQPADEFVARLVAADDVLRHLSLIKVGAVATPVPVLDGNLSTAPRLAPDDSLRTALSLLLSTGAEHIAVVDDQLVGVLRFAELRAATHSVRQQLSTNDSHASP